MLHSSTEVKQVITAVSLKPASGRYRNYAFTSYNGKIEFTPKMEYLIQGFEICPTTGREHWQGVVVFKNARAEGAVWEDYPKMHIKHCYKELLNNEKYCKKDGKWIEEGVRPVGQGKREDIRGIVDAVKEGKSDKEIFEEFGDKALRIYRGIDFVRNAYNDEKRNWVMDNRIYWGLAESGKTKAVYDEFGVNEIYVKSVGKWWDNYRNEKVVLIDDFDPDNCFDIQYDFYLKLLDRYPMQVEIKGGFKNFNSKIIIFTSNHDPKDWFKGKKNKKAFERRISSIKHFEGGLEEIEEIEDIFEGMDKRCIKF